MTWLLLLLPPAPVVWPDLKGIRAHTSGRTNRRSWLSCRLAWRVAGVALARRATIHCCGPASQLSWVATTPPLAELSDSDETPFPSINRSDVDDIDILAPRLARTSGPDGVDDDEIGKEDEDESLLPLTPPDSDAGVGLLVGLRRADGRFPRLDALKRAAIAGVITMPGGKSPPRAAASGRMPAPAPPPMEGREALRGSCETDRCIDSAVEEVDEVDTSGRNWDEADNATSEPTPVLLLLLLPPSSFLGELIVPIVVSERARPRSPCWRCSPLTPLTASMPEAFVACLVLGP